MPAGLMLLAWPLVEIALFVLVGEALGLWPVLGLVLLSAAAGALVIRVTGPMTLGNLQSALARGEDPLNPVAHAALVMIAAVLLILPGFLSDALALPLLVPAVRRLILSRVGARLSSRLRARGPGGGPGEVIDGEWSATPDSGSPWLR